MGRTCLGILECEHGARAAGGGAPAPAPDRRLPAALAVFACACAFVVQSPGWAQTSYMSLSRALSDGAAQIDPWHWETHDIAWHDGHYYSSSRPGSC